MTDYDKRSTVSDGDAHCDAQERLADANRSALTPGWVGARRLDTNWAWAKGTSGYDWMDHAPLFDPRD
ncbi:MULTISPECIES: hypothetical protein [Burkholderia]|uniref:Uncharacterized protein n=1 Tax=Burkholderia diffusa TaxID=488732 RepID=A0A6P2PFT9_9BURK|nr:MULTISPECIES: hypothetical protein [Burkholderia]KAB0661207.1 hypothetical protein F7R23_05965 [Burkholderia diffusa]MBM2656066.1 hypothetical protein [Burkholderia diffusa]RQR80205.1 hypothetical protein DIE11_16505 [Burkholderia sp. Bp9012]VWC06826.1 hypothetical protein BDI24065_05153 [Burkholderia diffusa]